MVSSVLCLYASYYGPDECLYPQAAGREVLQMHYTPVSEKLYF